MSRKVIQTPAAPTAIGPYSQAVIVSGGRTLYTSGQIALDPVSGGLVGDGDIAAQTRQVLTNLEAVLEAGGMRFSDVARVGIFLADMRDFTTVNEIYAERFSTNPPARSTVEVARLPKDVLVEIDVVAVAD